MKYPKIVRHGERARRLPIKWGRAVLEEICSAGQFADVIGIVARHDCTQAVQIIDNLDQLSAALVLSYFRWQAQKGDEYAKELAERAGRLHIKGSLGLVYARNKVFRETGYLVGV